MSIVAKKTIGAADRWPPVEIALAVARGTARLLHAHGFSVVSELSLPSAGAPIWRRSNARREIWIVEVKSSVADFRADQKWQDYRAHCDVCFLPPRKTCRARFSRPMPG